MKKRVVAAVLSMVLLPAASVGALDGGTDGSFSNAIGTFEETACFFELPPGQDVTCGYVTVPERHAHPDGPTIRLAVAVIKSTSPDPAPDPLVIESGGPGFPSLLAAPSALNMLDFRAQRDLVIIEQRGIGDSEPNLICEEGAVLLREIYGQNPADTELIELETGVLTTCRARWVARGVDLSAYNSLENAADFPLVLSALGYDQFNFYGISYASALAQHLLRDYPDRLRSVILDAVVPLDVRFNARVPWTASRAFRHLFEQCAADPVCSAHFPDLENVFFGLVDWYNANPVTVAVDDPWGSGRVDAVITGDFLVVALYEQLYTTRSIALLPASIYALADGDQYFINEFVTPTALGALRVTSGMSNSVMCSEFADHSVESTPAEDVYPHVANAMRDYMDYEHVCVVWDVEPIPAAAHEPFSSDVPTLILSGEYDPVTPPEYGARVAGWLPNSYAYTFPGVGHGSMSSSVCSFSITLQFLADPAREPDSSCLDELALTFVTSLDGSDVVLVPVTVEEYGVSGVAPEGWSELEPGTFVSPGYTMVLSLYSVADWWTAISDLDAVQVAGTRDVNGVIWTLHDAEFQGYHGTMALTTGPDQVYVVSVFSLEDNLPALVEHILSPALDAFVPVSE
jgi:pimeloyl-ACP methyl ester carboxylesterase